MLNHAGTKNLFSRFVFEIKNWQIILVHYRTELLKSVFQTLLHFNSTKPWHTIEQCYCV